MPIIPTTVGELRRNLETYPDDLEVFVQGDTERDPNATPQHFVVEYYPAPEAEPPLLLLAGIPYNSVPLKNVRDPNASFNLPK